MELICPLCGEYTGSASGVQAHISSKNDQAHKGKQGKDVIVNPAQPELQSGGKPTDEKDKTRPGKAQGDTDELPNVECGECGREVKYPELMPYKASCPDCGFEMRQKRVFEETERQADEPGNDETKGAKAA
mgnify:CR=1 FL=1